jgi:hypothetical protein
MSSAQKLELESNPLYMKPAAGVSFFTSAQNPPAGTFIEWENKAKRDLPPPKLFTPLKIRGLTMENRAWVSLFMKHIDNY